MLVVCIFAHPTVALAQTPPIQLWHITFTSQTDLQTLGRDYDVWEVDHTQQRVLAALTPDDAAWLAATHTLELAPDQSPLAPAPIFAAQASGIPGYACYRTVDETFATHDQLALDYPNLVQMLDIGESWDRMQMGAPAGDALRVLILTNQHISGPKFRFFLMGAIHAREYTTSELALRFAETLLQSYGTDANATWLLDHGELHLLTVANPDGRRIAETGQLWRKNTNTDAACAIVSLPSSGYGVDLNRNSSFKWNGCQSFSCSSADSCRETYRGIAPASEPEIAALEAYLRAIYPDQRADDLTDAAPLTKSGVLISLHSYGRLVLFPWGWTSEHAPNAFGLATLARRIGYPLGYTVCQAGSTGCLYQTDGTTDDFAYGELGLASYTIELGTAFFQSCDYFENSILLPGLAALRYAFKAAPQPYTLAQGPEVIALSATPNHIDAVADPNTSVTISATLDASRIAFLSGSNVISITEPTERIRAARLTIDHLPWEDQPFFYPLTAADGAFNTVQEIATATLDLACLPDGRHTLYAQAQDEGDDWGIVAADFVTVTNSSPFTLTMHGQGGEITVGQHTTYTLVLTNTAVTTSTYAVEVEGEVTYTVQPSTVVTLAPASTLTLTVAITPKNITASTSMPAVIIVRSMDVPAHCRQVGVITPVAAQPYRQRLLIIAKH